MSVQAVFMPRFNDDTTTTTITIRDVVGTETVTQTFPLAGTIKRILIGSNGDIGNGSVQIQRFPNGVLPAVNLASVPYTGFIGTGTTKITYEQPFEKDDGLVIQIIRNTNNDARTLTITLEIEYATP